MFLSSCDHNIAKSAFTPGPISTWSIEYGAWLFWMCLLQFQNAKAIVWAALKRRYACFDLKLIMLALKITRLARMLRPSRRSSRPYLKEMSLLLGSEELQSDKPFPALAYARESAPNAHIRVTGNAEVHDRNGDFRQRNIRMSRLWTGG